MRHSKWFKLAAEQGDDLSQKCMGLCYEHGDGVAVDKKEAEKWCALARLAREFSS